MNRSILLFNSFRLFHVLLFSVPLLLITASNNLGPTIAKTAKPDDCLPGINFASPPYGSLL
jgi:hypothetical protein